MISFRGGKTAMSKIYILLTKFFTKSANFLSFVTNFHYTHVSIGLEEDLNTFYSFVNKGFIEEKITKYVKKDREPFPCMLYEINVSKKTYNKIKKSIESFKNKKDVLQYSNLGIACSLIGVPIHRENKYFCSEFVAKILKENKIINKKKKASLFLPKDFSKIKEAKPLFVGTHKSMVEKYSLTLLPT
jgi:hypothetical protein